MEFNESAGKYVRSEHRVATSFKRSRGSPAGPHVRSVTAPSIVCMLHAEHPLRPSGIDSIPHAVSRPS